MFFGQIKSEEQREDKATSRANEPRRIDKGQYEYYYGWVLGVYHTSVHHLHCLTHNLHIEWKWTEDYAPRLSIAAGSALIWIANIVVVGVVYTILNPPDFGFDATVPRDEIRRIVPTHNVYVGHLCAQWHWHNRQAKSTSVMSLSALPFSADRDQPLQDSRRTQFCQTRL